MKFYNPKMSSFESELSLIKMTVQIAMAKSLDPTITRPQKGQKVYDFENKVFFSLSCSECVGIVRNWKSILDGSYSDPKADEKYRGSYSVVHYRNNVPSRLILSPSKKGDKLTGSMITTIMPTQGNPISYVFRDHELLLFYHFIKCAVEKFPYDHALHYATIKHENKRKYDEKNDGNSSGGGGDSSYRNQTVPDNVELPDDPSDSTDTDRFSDDDWD